MEMSMKTVIKNISLSCALKVNMKLMMNIWVSGGEGNGRLQDIVQKMTIDNLNVAGQEETELTTSAF